MRAQNIYQYTTLRRVRNVLSDSEVVCVCARWRCVSDADVVRMHVNYVYVDTAADAQAPASDR